MGNQSIMNGASALIDKPTITVIDVEVQHPVSLGGLANSLGTIGCGIIIQPTGQPKIMIDIQHPDGKRISSFLRGHELMEFIEMLMEAGDTATSIADQVAKAVKQ